MMMIGDSYICMTCRELGVDTIIPADKVGAALMQQHLKSEHGVWAGQMKACEQCYGAVLIALGGNAPTSCKEHS